MSGSALRGCAAAGAAKEMKAVKAPRVSRIGAGPWDTPDPFLFCVYHKDQFPAGDGKCQAPKRGNGQDFNPNAAYRMYHGEKVPGFPQHPHRGFETITATMTGIIDHTDSLGNCGRYGDGDLQWMTAGKGVVHGEMFPLVKADAPNPCRFFQIWINLPAVNKMVDPDFVMHWGPEVPTVSLDDGKVSVVVWCGPAFGVTPSAPPKASWANDAKNDVALWKIEIQPGGKLSLPAAHAESNRHAFFFEGDALTIGGTSMTPMTKAILDADDETVIENTGTKLAEVLILQGRPIAEPVAQHGPFVMNTQEEIEQCFTDYRRTQFGGWPWPEDAMVFPPDKARFAKVNGVTSLPPKGGR